MLQAIYASSSSSTPTGTPCYDNASLVTAEVLIRTATQSENKLYRNCNSHVLVLQYFNAVLQNVLAVQHCNSCGLASRTLTVYWK